MHLCYKRLSSLKIGEAGELNLHLGGRALFVVGSLFPALSSADYVNLNQKLTQWEKYYNFCRSYGALRGCTPYEPLRENLKDQVSSSPEV
jgi:hypothetical protein